MLRPLKVLFADDLENDVLLMVRELEQADLKVDWKRVDNRTSLEQAIRTQEWDIVVVDYVIPGLGGLQVLAVIEKICSELPAIAVSGHVSEGVIVETLQGGACDYVLKSNLTRFAPSVQRALVTSDTRREKLWAEQEIRRLYRETSVKYKIAEIALTSPSEEWYLEVLQVILRELESHYGIFGYVHDQGHLVCSSLAGNVEGKYELLSRDISLPPQAWKDCLSEKTHGATELTFVNQLLMASDEHVPIKCSLSVPILRDSKVIGFLMVANKSQDYTGEDDVFLKMIADHVSPILQSRLDTVRKLQQYRKTREKLVRREATLQKLLAGIENASLPNTLERPLLDCNDPACQLLGNHTAQVECLDLPPPSEQSPAERCAQSQSKPEKL